MKFPSLMTGWQRWVSRRRAIPTASATVSHQYPAFSDAQIAVGLHRQHVGGMWDEIGRLQLQFLQAEGLKPAHALVDVGCGALRGGIHFVRYLEPGHYCGLDINASLLRAGRKELADAGLADKDPHLLASDQFELWRFGRTFDFGIAVSLFTHLYLNQIARCLAEMTKVMHRTSRFYCSFFEAPAPLHLEPITHSPGEMTTHYDADPFHQAAREMDNLARHCGLNMRYVGDWHHPRDQQMLCFTLSP